MNNKLNCFPKILGLFILSSIIGGCSSSKTETMCSVSDYTKIRDLCLPGDTLFFAPRTFGNEQLPLIVAAGACDMKKNVIWNTGGLVCTMSTPKNVRE